NITIFTTPLIVYKDGNTFQYFILALGNFLNISIFYLLERDILRDRHRGRLSCCLIGTDKLLKILSGMCFLSLGF
ncbi:hypothetical protein ACJX0J_005680, partial [Zea mays]